MLTAMLTAAATNAGSSMRADVIIANSSGQVKPPFQRDSGTSFFAAPVLCRISLSMSFCAARGG
jgi:hypothetical protein